MKKVILFLSILLAFIVLCAQDVDKDLRNKRDNLLNNYFQHRDTVTVRTWINVITSNKYLEEIRIMDSILLTKNSNALEKPYQMIDDLEEDVNNLTKQNLALKSQIDAVYEKDTFEKTTFQFTILVASIFLILFVLLFFGYIAAKRKAERREAESRNYLTKLNEANHEVEKMQQTEHDLAHKLNVIQTDYQENFNKIKLSKSEIEDVKILLENQIIEVKKAYDYEVVKRIEIESELVLAKQHDRLAQNSDLLKTRILELEESSKLLEVENENIDNVLTKTLLALEGEVSIRKSVENTLNSLIVQLEQIGIIKNGSHDLKNLSTELKTYNILITENEFLKQSLESLRSDFNQELKRKIQLQDDLNQIVARLGGHV